MSGRPAAYICGESLAVHGPNGVALTWRNTQPAVPGAISPPEGTMIERVFGRRRSGLEVGVSRRTVLLGVAGTVAAAAVLRPGGTAKADSGGVNPDVMQWSDYIYGASSWSGVPAYLLAGLIDVESSGDRWLVSDAGALGLTQIMPWWFDDLGVDLDRWSEP